MWETEGASVDGLAKLPKRRPSLIGAQRRRAARGGRTKSRSKNLGLRPVSVETRRTRVCQYKSGPNCSFTRVSWWMHSCVICLFKLNVITDEVASECSGCLETFYYFFSVLPDKSFSSPLRNLKFSSISRLYSSILERIATTFFCMALISSSIFFFRIFNSSRSWILRLVQHIFHYRVSGLCELYVVAVADIPVCSSTRSRKRRLCRKSFPLPGRSSSCWSI